MRQMKVRSFPTKCQRCGAPVLYWEGDRGTKIFFNLPIYGKPISHRCKRQGRKKRLPIKTHHELLVDKLEKVTYQCPVCSKLCNTELALTNHIKKMKKQDDEHSEFFGQTLDLINFDDEEEMMAKASDFKTDQSVDVFNGRFLIKNKDKKRFEEISKYKQRN